MAYKSGVLRFLILLSLVVLTCGKAAAQVERHALILGNSSYTDRPLLNPVNDARDMAQQLSTLGYKVYGDGPTLDQDRIGIERVVRAFARQLPENAHALLYYAGHGVAHAGDNYMIPVRHNLQFEEQLPDRAVSLRSVVNLLKNANPEGINIVLLDACSDNPLTASFRGLRQGLDRLYDIPRGIFIGYAADVGQVAEDGLTRNGTYTSELLSVMREQPNLIIELAHKEVAERVLEKTDGKQFPVSENKVYGDWCFGECLIQNSAVPEVAAVENVPVFVPPTVESGSKKGWMFVGGAVVLAAVVALAARDSDDPVNSDSVFVSTDLP